MCDLFYSIFSFLSFFFLRVCVSAAHMGCMLIGKCKLWHSSKGIPNTLGKEMAKWNEDEGRKQSLGWKDHPLCCFLIIHVPFLSLPLFLTPFSLYPLQHLHLFFSYFLQNPNCFSRHKLQDKEFVSSFGGLFVSSHNFLWHNPSYTTVRGIREFIFGLPCCLFGFITSSFITQAHVFK